MKKLMDINKLTYTSEYFSKVNSKFSNWMILIIGIFIFIFFLWIFIGRCEKVVYGNGTVRSSENISSVHSPNSGKISNIYFTDGQIVKKGDILFTLYYEVETKSKNNILEKIKIINERILEIDLMVKSLNLNKNIIPKENIVAYTKVKNFFETKNQMLEVCEVYEKNLNTQKDLPKNVVSNDNILEAERVFSNAKIKLSQYSQNFLTDLILEKESYEIQLDNYKTNLVGIENIIESKKIRAPIDGTVLAFKEINENDFIVASQNVLSIIPMIELGYEIVVKVKERDIINLEYGLKAKVKLTAYSNKFVDFKATVIKISADSISNGSDLFYLVTLSPDHSDQVFDNKDLNFAQRMILKSGMQAIAKIVVAEQSIFSYIVDKLEITL